MYCTKCGSKKEDGNFCINCGNKYEDLINKNNSGKSFNYSIIVGVISIFLALSINVFSIPLAIFGIIIGLKYSKMNIGVILNICSIVISIFILIIICLLFVNFNSVVEKEVTDYNNDSNNFKEDIKKSDMDGFWYLYDNGVKDVNSYVAFSNGNFTLSNSNGIYTGKYSFFSENFDHNSSNYSYYTVTLVPNSLRDKDGKIVNSKLDKQEFHVSINGDEMIMTLVGEDNVSFYFEKSSNSFGGSDL